MNRKTRRGKTAGKAKGRDLGSINQTLPNLIDGVDCGTTDPQSRGTGRVGRKNMRAAALLQLIQPLRTWQVVCHGYARVGAEVIAQFAPKSSRGIHHEGWENVTRRGQKAAGTRAMVFGSRSKSLPILTRRDKGLNHLGRDVVAIELDQFLEPEVITRVIIVRCIIRIAPQVTKVLRQHKGAI